MILQGNTEERRTTLSLLRASAYASPEPLFHWEGSDSQPVAMVISESLLWEKHGLIKRIKHLRNQKPYETKRRPSSCELEIHKWNTVVFSSLDVCHCDNHCWNNASLEDWQGRAPHRPSPSQTWCPWNDVLDSTNRALRTSQPPITSWPFG